MRDIDWEAVPESGDLVLLTAEDVASQEPLKMADFKDSHGLFYKALGGWLGLSRTGVRMGKEPIWMQDGLWMCKADEDSQRRHPNHDPDVTRIYLRPIP